MFRWYTRWSLANLERQFLLLTTLTLGLVGVLLYFVIAGTMTANQEQAAIREAGENNAILSHLFLGLNEESPPAQIAAIDQALAAQGTRRFSSVKVWNPAGRILYATDHTIIGQVFPPGENPALANALQGKVVGHLADLAKAENATEQRLGFTALIEVYTPLSTASGQVVGAFEVYQDGSALVQGLRELRVQLGVGLLLGLLAVFAVLFGLIRFAGRSLREDHQALVRLERQLEDTLRGALSALSEAVEAKDEYTGGHVERVAAYAVAVAAELGVPEAELREVEFAALLHDVGKISIPDAILLKPGALSPSERQLMMTHSAKGEHILARVPALQGVARAVRHHHERWDGMGYPDGLSGDAVPLASRIVAVVDTYDAMTTTRPYRVARGREEALAELSRMSGTQFDPAVVAAFQRLAPDVVRRVAAPA